MQARVTKEKDQLNQHKGDYRKYWRTIRQIVTSKKSQNNKISLIELNSAAEIPSAGRRHCNYTTTE